jgi:hypothetical protein
MRREQGRGGEEVNTKELLTKTRELIADPKHWRQGSNIGRGSYCLLEALRATDNTIKMLTDTTAYKILAEETRIALDGTPIGLARYNDTHSHADVIALLDKAIARAW